MKTLATHRLGEFPFILMAGCKFSFPELSMLFRNTSDGNDKGEGDLGVAVGSLPESGKSHFPF